MEEGKAHQLWKKGEFDAENYFYLENSGVPKVLTAISESSLEIKGNITMRWILLKVGSQERDSSLYECSPVLGPCSKNPLQNVSLTKLI